MPRTLPDRLMSVREVAIALGYTYAYTLALVSDGTIPSVQRAKGCARKVDPDVLRGLYSGLFVQSQGKAS